VVLLSTSIKLPLISSVSVMSRIGGLERQSGGHNVQIQNQEYEFRMGSVSVSPSMLLIHQLGDSLGIVLASIVSIPMQVALCAAQVQRGRDLCTRT